MLVQAVCLRVFLQHRELFFARLEAVAHSVHVPQFLGKEQGVISRIGARDDNGTRLLGQMQQQLGGLGLPDVIGDRILAHHEVAGDLAAVEEVKNQTRAQPFL